MTKIYSGEMHGNDNASTRFRASIIGARDVVRSTIAMMETSRKADEFAPGAIHALRKLCDGEGRSQHVLKEKTIEWRACFLAWFERVRRWIPDEYADDYLANAEDDFRVILECSGGYSLGDWRLEAKRRFLTVTFENDEHRRAADAAADEKYPVKLGHALSDYLQRCINDLLEQSPPQDVSTIDEKVVPVFQSRIDVNLDGGVCLYIDDFILMTSNASIPLKTSSRTSRSAPTMSRAPSSATVLRPERSIWQPSHLIVRVRCSVQCRSQYRQSLA